MNKTNKRMLVIIFVIVAVVAFLLIAFMVSGNGKIGGLTDRHSGDEKYLDELDYQKAIVLYEIAIWLDPKNEEAYLELANVYIAMGDYNSAISVLGLYEGDSETIAEKTASVLLLAEQKNIETNAEDNESVNGEMAEADESDNNDTVEEETDEPQEEDWRGAYVSFLSGLVNEPGITGDFFYVDGDDIPELIIDYYLGPALYKYYQGNVVEAAKSEADGLGMMCTFERKSAFATYFGDDGGSIYYFYRLNEDGSTEPIFSAYEYIDMDYMGEWAIDNVSVTKKEYYTKIKELYDAYGELMGSFEYDRSVSDLIILLEGEDVIPEGTADNRRIYSGELEAMMNEGANEAAHNLYNSVLNYARNGMYHDGTPNDAYIDAYIQYAYADIDNDSIDELIISNSASFSAGCAAYIYDYDPDTDKINMIYDGQQNISIYSNGIITVADDRNSSLGIMWPFSVYRRSASGVYEYETYVSSWSVEYGDYDYGTYFPYETDMDGNGVVYKVHNTYIDDSEFDSWYNTNLADELRIDIEYSNL